MDAAEVETLWDVLGLVPDQRSRHGRRAWTARPCGPAARPTIRPSSFWPSTVRGSASRTFARLEHCREHRQRLIHLMRYGITE